MQFNAEKAWQEYNLLNPKSSPMEAFLDGLALGVAITEKTVMGVFNKVNKELDNG